MQELVNTVRSTGATNVIMLTGIQYGMGFAHFLEHMPSDPQRALVASAHVYNFSWHANDPGYWDTTMVQVASVVPIVAGEIGEDSGGVGWVRGKLDWFDAHGVGYLAWTWNVWHTKLDLIYDYATGTPAKPWGELFKSRMSGSAPGPTPPVTSFDSAARRVWEQTDKPVAEGRVSRTWMWGPTANSQVMTETYVEGQDGTRKVQYFDKSRMEVTHPGGDPKSAWYVTNGLLATELITGRLQIGDDQFEQRGPAHVNVAGDIADPNGPTYATFSALMGDAPLSTGDTVTWTVDRAGNIGNQPDLSRYGVRATEPISETNHSVASVFWDFMQSGGPVYADGAYRDGRLFENPFYATGLPITEPYWTTVSVGGTPRQVLVQVFERRVLTWTPDNPSGWQVEAGNVGLHYYLWRYGSN
jgi:hypothetical protein